MPLSNLGCVNLCCCYFFLAYFKSNIECKEWLGDISIFMSGFVSFIHFKSIILLLDIDYYSTDASKPAFGPNGRWYVHQIEKRDNLHALWHLTWVFIIPYFSCIVIFFSIIHFPDGKIGKFFLNHNMRTGTLCVFFSTVQKTLEAVGFAGGGLQGDFFNDPVSQFNVLLMLTTMVLTMFTGYRQRFL